MGVLAGIEGDHARGRELLLAALTRFQAAGDRRGEALTHYNLGRIAMRAGALGEAAPLLRAGLDMTRALGFPQITANSFQAFGEIAAARCEHAHAALLIGAGDGLLDAIGAGLEEFERPGYEAALGSLEAALGADGLADALARGRALSDEEALALAYAIDAAERRRSSRR